MNNQNFSSKKIGVLFCGGCNPTYNRELVYRQLKKHYEPAIIFGFYEEADEYNLLLIINGCSSECLINQAYSSPVVCLDTSDINVAIQKIEDMLHVC